VTENRASNLTGLYVHLPFCRVKCTYCAFAISTDLSLEAAYVEQLCREIELRANGARLQSLYFGGGTPSRTSPASLRRIVATIRECCDTSALEEFSFEANPEDLNEDFLDLIVELGVDRLSLGVQSLQDDELYPLGRGHGRQRALDAIRAATSRNLRVSADLILGLPKQSVDSYRRTLHELLDLGIGHVSVYMLDLEEGTALERQVKSARVMLPDDDLVAALYFETIAVAAERGLAQYEISNFARPGEESRHNLRYWNREPYIGVGTGAHSFDGIDRYANTRDTRDYIERMRDHGGAMTFRETPDKDEVVRERLFLSLRQAVGIDYAELRELKGEEAEEWVSRGLQEKWLRERGGRIAFTADGFVLSNEYLSQLF
jgi:oxygen-independent coproporphyrinogen III oxidase